MQPDQFISNLAGDVIRMPSGYFAYVPHAPPDAIDYNGIAPELSAADAALGELSGLSSFVPNPALLIRPYLQREAVASSQIEGTQADINDLLIEDVDDRGPHKTDAFEIRNYINALNYGLEQLNAFPLASRLICAMHQKLMQGVRGQERMPGEFRRSQNWIRGSGPTDALYVPPPPDRLLDCIGVWERFVNARGPMPDLVRCAIAHEYFETVHPFLDGNGRMGRLLITLMLVERKRLTKPMLYVSSYIEQTKTEYYDRLQAVRTHGQRTEWIRYFLTAVQRSARDAVDRTNAVLKLRDTLLNHPDVKSQHRAKSLIDALFVNPYVTIQHAAKMLEVSDTTADKSIRLLLRCGVLTEVTGKSWGRIWVATPILRAIHQSVRQNV